jgi:copper chaperone NosL
MRLSDWTIVTLTTWSSLIGHWGCSPSEITPIDIYPEDMCSQCRMAISDQRFASEIISDQREVFKFDDIGCMEQFRSLRNDLKIAAVFYKDYETKHWIPSDHATIVETDVMTPMGSGKVAFADSVKAKELATKEHR